MKSKVLISLLFILLGCQNTSEKKTAMNGITIDTSKSKIHSSDHQTDRFNLSTFLENSIDLKEFKKRKGQSLSSVAKLKDYYYKPEIENSLYYLYSTFPNDSLWEEISPTEIVVFKYGQNKHTWDDNNEILIELTVTGNDSDLKMADIVGFTLQQLESKFGTVYQVLDNRIIYSYENKILIIELEGARW